MRRLDGNTGCGSDSDLEGNGGCDWVRVVIAESIEIGENGKVGGPDGGESSEDDDEGEADVLERGERFKYFSSSSSLSNSDSHRRFVACLVRLAGGRGTSMVLAVAVAVAVIDESGRRQDKKSPDALTSCYWRPGHRDHQTYSDHEGQNIQPLLSLAVGCSAPGLYQHWLKRGPSWSWGI